MVYKSICHSAAVPSYNCLSTVIYFELFYPFDVFVIIDQMFEIVFHRLFFEESVHAILPFALNSGTWLGGIYFNNFAAIILFVEVLLRKTVPP